MPLYVPSSSVASGSQTLRSLVDTSTGDTVVTVQALINGVWITIYTVTNPTNP